MNEGIPWLQLIFALVGGTALLVHGIRVAGEGLEEAAGRHMRRFLGIMTRNVYLGFLVSTIVVAAVGSSSAITVMTVGFVNAGVMDLRQACGIIYGANVGTTSDAVGIALLMSVEKLDIKIVALGMMGLGFVMMLLSKRRKFRSPGKAIFGFGLVFLSLVVLKSGATYIKDSPAAIEMFANMGRNPLLGVLVGIVVTFLVQSSSTSVAMNLALAQARVVNLPTSLAFILGDNIGTCFTAQLAAIGTSLPARRTAWAHTLHNVIGVVIALIFFPFLLQFAQWISPNILRQIAFTHALFNVGSALLFLPLTNQFVALLLKLVPGEVVKVESGPRFLDKLLLDSPDVAIDQTRQEIVAMAGMAQEMLDDATEIFRSSDTRRMAGVVQREAAVDGLEEECVRYMVELSQHPLELQQSSSVAGLLHAVSDIERISDHALNIAQAAEEKANERLFVSEQAMDELEEIYEKVRDNLETVIQMLAASDSDRLSQMADDVGRREDEIDDLELALRQRHIQRLRTGVCDPTAGILYVTVLSNFERISDHCTNIAEAVCGPIKTAEQ